jgi:hypothetical protein
VDARIADLIDDQIVLAPSSAPDKVVRALDSDDSRARRSSVVGGADGHFSLVDADVDAVAVLRQRRNELGGPSGDAARLRRPGREPGEAHG